MIEVNADGRAFPNGSHHLPALLGHLLDLLGRDVADHSGEAGPGTVSRTVTQRLRPSQLRLLDLTPAHGMRVTDLATRAAMTKQALGELAAGLEERGLMETARDETDRRVRILRPTPAGLAARDAAHALVAEVEARWRDRVGPETWDTMRACLAEVIARGEGGDASGGVTGQATTQAAAQPTTRPRSTTREGSQRTDRSSSGLRG